MRRNQTKKKKKANQDEEKQKQNALTRKRGTQIYEDYAFRDDDQLISTLFRDPRDCCRFALIKLRRTFAHRQRKC